MVFFWVFWDYSEEEARRRADLRRQREAGQRQRADAELVRQQRGELDRLRESGGINQNTWGVPQQNQPTNHQSIFGTAFGSGTASAGSPGPVSAIAPPQGTRLSPVPVGESVGGREVSSTNRLSPWGGLSGGPPCPTGKLPRGF